ncbi:MAG: pyridoxal-phosphate dependent enzyme [Gammaproteobacteria bacterium]|nr:MAG: pyridoxal-phosphate dependent enzyme [Gammaproteobacteria bacterium]
METSLSRGGLSLDTLSAPRIEATLRHGVITTIDKALLDAAWETVRPLVRWTPMLRSDHVDSLVGARVFLKAESLQLAGSFKMRGACFRVSRLSPDERGRGVVAFSSGNFAQALALAGRLAGVPVTIVMPCDAPERKALRRSAGRRRSVDADARSAARRRARAGAIRLHSLSRRRRGIDRRHCAGREAFRERRRGDRRRARCLR